jgi:hypothetical protein
MKTIFKIGAFVAVLLIVGCTDREAEARKAREDAEAKATAEAARKEMEALSKAFKSRDIFKKNGPEEKSAPTPEEPKNP